MNHNAGDVTADAAFVTVTSNGTDTPSTWNVTLRHSLLTRYCVEVLAADVPGTVTTGGDPRFADYLSCGNGDDISDPQCTCDVWIDRNISGDVLARELVKSCHAPGGQQPCTDPHTCTCSCTNASLGYSATYTGMMPLYFNGPELLGYFYSFPKATECKEGEAVGTLRADGATCTWKRHPEARTLRGADALSAGWNTTLPPALLTLEAAQARQNAAVLRRVFDSRDLQPWMCEQRPRD